jgi:serpin B
MWICTTALLVALSTGTVGQDNFPTISPQETLIEGMNTTGVALAGKLLPGADKGNLVISPYSAVMAHLMLAYGCKGADRTELLKGLGLADLADDRAILDSAGLQKVLTGIAGKPFTSADAFMTIGKAKPVETFKRQIQRTFDGEFFALTEGEALDKVNKWAAEKTKNRIPKLLDDLDSAIFLVLMNAATYDGDWLEPFDPHRSYKGEPTNFTLGDGTKIVADMMFRHAMSTPFMSATTFDAIRLPYKDKAFSMIVMLPHENSDPTAVLGELSNTTMPAIVHAMKPERATVRMPKFTIRTKCDLIAPLRSLGINRIFEGFNARGMATFPTPPPDQVGLDLQQAYVEVDELGTKAAAVTIIGVKATMVLGGPVKDFVVDRPFVYAIVHNDTGLTTFLGVCSTPPKAKGN